MSDIFISYARNDRETAQQLAKALEAQSWSVWWDTRLRAGEAFDSVIARELAAARCVVVLWSKASVQRNWVREEAREGLRRGILVPVRIENVEPPLPFKGIHAGDLIGWNGHAAHSGFKQLMADVAGSIGPPSQNLVAPPPIEEPGPEPARPAPDDGSRRGKITTFLKNAWLEWFKHFVATIKHYFAAIAGRRPRKRHLATAGGIALLVVVVVGYSLYKLQPPDPDDKPPESREVACHDQEAVDSLVNRLGRAKEIYNKSLIDIKGLSL